MFAVIIFPWNDLATSLTGQFKHLGDLLSVAITELDPKDLASNFDGHKPWNYHYLSQLARQCCYIVCDGRFESTWDFPKLAGHLLTSEVHDIRLEVLFFMLDSLEGREPAGMREFDESPTIVSENVERTAVDEKRKMVVLESIRNNLLNLIVEMIVSGESHPLCVVQVGLRI